MGLSYRCSVVWGLAQQRCAHGQQVPNAADVLIPSYMTRMKSAMVGHIRSIQIYYTSTLEGSEYQYPAGSIFLDVNLDRHTTSVVMRSSSILLRSDV